MKKRTWFTYVFVIYSLVFVVDRLLYRFWGIGTNEDNMLTMWICLLPLWIYFLLENKNPPSEAS
jgi:hypothetical protein